mgnify:CR=1 FL=1
MAEKLKKDGEPLPLEGDTLEKNIDILWLYNILKALNPYKIWLIVVLVSFISLVGYIAVKILGPGAGIGLTGFIGGLASSTVTTVSFAKRSLESPAFNKSFAVAILLASSIMFPYHCLYFRYYYRGVLLHYLTGSAWLTSSRR